MTKALTHAAVEPPPLLPAQQKALEGLEHELGAHGAAILVGRPGAGKTSILKALHARIGGTSLTSREFIEASLDRHPLALDETVYKVLRSALDSAEVVIVDDFHLISMVTCCSHSYPRLNFLAATIVPLVTMARDEGKTLVFATEGMPVGGLHDRVPRVLIPLFKVEDYAALADHYLGRDHSRLVDMQKIHRFAPKLNARQLRSTCEALALSLIHI